MSIAKIENSETIMRNNPATLNFKALSALASGDKQYASGRYGAQIVPDKNDSRTVIILKNAHSASVNVNVAPGTSPYNAENPLVVAVPATSQVAISLDSALYKDLSIDGYIIYTTDSNYANISVACVTLP